MHCADLLSVKQRNCDTAVASSVQQLKRTGIDISKNSFKAWSNCGHLTARDELAIVLIIKRLGFRMFF